MLKYSAAIVLAVTLVVYARDINLLLKMIPAQQEFFTKKIIKKFEKKSGCRVFIKTFKDNKELVKILSSKEAKIDVVKVPMGIAYELVQKSLVNPLQFAVSADRLEKMKKKYFLMNLATINGTVYYIPRKFETRITVYLKSRVRKAVSGWSIMKERINQSLMSAYGTELPADYVLEKDPSRWDYMDIFVAGFYWANTDYGGKKAGRIAHGAKEYGGTARELMDRCFQMGAKKKDVIRVSSEFYREVLKWESLYAANRIYPREMWTQGWSGRDIWNAFGDGRIFLSFLTQIECFVLRGTGAKAMKGFLKKPGDLGFAVMPQAVYMDGKKTGGRGTSTGGWFWGLGMNASGQKDAVDLIEHITGYENQLAECKNFGIIPARNDILGREKMVLGRAWKTRMYKTSLKQLEANGKTSLPYAFGFERIEKRYINIWKKVVERSSTGPLDERRIMNIFFE
jgi:ABC-type glycerol-3-phosphate transport system substrate-binding protein